MSSSGCAPLTIRLFGPFDAQLGSHPLPRLRSRSEQWLLALLALRHGREVERGWLAGLLWPDSPGSVALANLRRALTELRRALGPEAKRLLSPTPRTFSLDLVGVVLDVAEFDDAVGRGDARSLERAIVLYRGPLLEGCTEEWAFQERQMREQAVLAAIETLAALATERGEHAVAERLLRRAVALDPLREEAQRALMRALAAGGNYAGATVAYRELRELLHRELHAAPAPETVELDGQIRSEARRLAQTPQPAREAENRRERRGWDNPLESEESGHAPRIAAAPSAARLPTPLTELVGREREIRELQTCLTRTRLLTLTGPGGVGKTRLALRLAEEAAPVFSSGVGFVDLAPLAEAAQVPRAVAAALGVEETPGSAPVALLCSFLCTRQMLLVLDNCEHLVEACAQLAESLLHGCPQLRIIATSREALGITGELEWRVPTLTVPEEGVGLTVDASEPLADSLTRSSRPRVDQPTALLQYGAVRLFTERASAVAPSFTLTPGNAQAAVQVCRRLDGIPLALELAAAMVKVFTVEQVAERLDDRFSLLRRGSRTALPRQQTLRTMMDWSYDLLAEPERVLLRRLSVFAGTFALEDAQAACGDRVDSSQLSVASEGTGPLPLSTVNCQLSTDDVLDLLTRLVDKSLVGITQHGVGHYRLLETTRAYARERLLTSGEVESVRQRHAEHFLDLAERAATMLRGPDQQAWLERLEAADDNLRAALTWWTQEPAGTADPEGGLRFVSALGRYWWLRARYAEGRHWIEGALAGRPARTAARAAALYAAARLTRTQGEYAHALALLDESQQIGLEVGDRDRVAAVANEIGLIAFHQGDIERACTLYEQALEICRETDDRLTLGAVLNNLGRAFQAQGDLIAAQGAFQQSLGVARKTGNSSSIAVVSRNLGAVARALGDTSLARTLYEEALALNRRLGNRAWEAGTLAGLGSVAFDEGDHAAAQVFYAQSLRISQEQGTRKDVEETLRRCARLAIARGEAARAARLCGAAATLLASLGATLPPSARDENERAIVAARSALDEAAFATAWAAGCALTLEQAIEYAVQSEQT